jgi:hypothetical protein
VRLCRGLKENDVPSSFRPSSRVRRFVVFAPAVTAITMIAMVATGPTAEASPPSPTVLGPGDLLVATSVFQNDPNIVAGTT